MNRFAPSPFPAAAEMRDFAPVLPALVLPEYTLPPTTEWQRSKRASFASSNVSELATKRHKIHRYVCECLCFLRLYQLLRMGGVANGFAEDTEPGHQEVEPQPGLALRIQ